MIFRHALGFHGDRSTEDARRRARSQGRLTTALLLSLLAHALLLSLQFGIRGLGLPALQLPWNERRAYAPALHIRIADVNSTPGAAANAAGVAPPSPLESHVRRAKIPSGSPPAPASGLRLLRPAEKAPHRMTPRHQVKRSPPIAPRPRKARTAQRHQHHTSAPPKPQPRLVATKQPAQESFSVPVASSEPSNAIGQQEQAPEMTEPTPPPSETDAREQALAAQREEERLQREREIAAQRQEEENARQQAQALEAQRQAAQQSEEENLRRIAQTEARKLEEEKRQAMALEAQRQAVQQLEEERQRRAQIEAARQEEENARRQAEELEARRQAEQIAQQQAAQQREQERLQQDRQMEEARRAEETARREAANHDALAQAAPPGQAQALASHADSTVAPSLPATPQDGSAPPTSGASDVQARDSAPADTDDGPILLSDSELAAAKVVQVRKVDATRLEPHAEQDARRRTIFGSADDDIVLKMYIDRWRNAVERNGNASDREQPPVQGDADVTVVIRSDGSIDNIIIHRSDERHELDQTVRRIAASARQQNAFPPDLLRRYDVVEIRRVWRFGDALRILEKGE